MRTIFGIDVSKASSEVAILVNSEKILSYIMLNDAIDCNRLLSNLKTVHNPEIIFEATGVYSRHLKAFLEEYGYAYTQLNPLEAKKQMDSLVVVPPALLSCANRQIINGFMSIFWTHFGRKIYKFALLCK